jgi:hypothetical protein
MKELSHTSVLRFVILASMILLSLSHSFYKVIFFLTFLHVLFFQSLAVTLSVAYKKYNLVTKLNNDLAYFRHFAQHLERLSCWNNSLPVLFGVIVVISLSQPVMSDIFVFICQYLMVMWILCLRYVVLTLCSHLQDTGCHCTGIYDITSLFWY